MMHTPPSRWFAPLTMASTVSLAMMVGPGCGGAGVQMPPNTMPIPATGAAGPSDATANANAKDRPTLVTPDRAVDPKQLVDVVEAEVEGGEATEGPTPKSFLWSPSAAPVEEEPMEVAVPVGLPPLPVPPYNVMTAAKVELGKQIYFDPRVSEDGTISCATCHNPDKGWTDNLDRSVGIHGLVGARSAPTVLNAAYGKSMFWDGRAPSLEGQAQGPIQNKIEMGDQSYQQIIERLRTISSYREQFQKVFGTDVTLDGMAKAVAAFERTVLSGNSAYDRYTRGEFDALSESQKRGMVLFGLRVDFEDTFKTEVTLQKAKCTLCHVGANFSDEQFHNLGVGWDAETGKFADLGRWAIAPIGAKNPSEIAAFKTPTLRDLVRTGPFMHDGSEKTLEEVVAFYDKGGNANPHLDKDMQPLKLTNDEAADLVEFLKALTGDEVKVALPTLPAGPDGEVPDPRSALQAPAPGTARNPFHPAAIR